MAGIFVPWLADAARLTGYPVAEVAGWRTRGHGGLAAVEGVLCHHTAGPKTGEAPSLAVVRDGRAGLAGPLSQYVLGRSGTVYVVAAGLSYHAGESRWAGRDPDGHPFAFTSLNSRFLGIEAESTGVKRADGSFDWTAEQRDVYPRLVAACLHYMRRGAIRAAAHREVAIPAGRKPDPTGIDMPGFRARVAHLLADPLRLIPRGTPTTSGDQLPTVSDLLNAPIGRAGDGMSGQTTLAGVAAWSDYHHTVTRGLIAALREEVVALRARPASTATLTGEQLDALAGAVVDELARRRPTITITDPKG